MNKELKTVKSKIAKLLALGNSNSVSEASVAMSKAQQLMEEWALSIDDIDIGNDDIVHEVITTEKYIKPETSGCITTLAEFTNCKVWVNSGKKWANLKYRINLLGYEQDVALFKHFWNMINYVHEVEYNAYTKTSEYEYDNKFYHGRALRKSFTVGFVDKVYYTLNDLVKKNENIVTRSGTALVPLKGGKIEEHFEENFDFKLTTRRSYNKHQTSAGYWSGSKAGANVSFNSAVGRQNGKVKLLA